MSSQDENPLLCPTFSSYSRDGLIEIAAKASNSCRNIFGEEENEDDNLFEFDVPNKELDCSVMYKPSTFPIFNPEIFDKFNETDKIIENSPVIHKSSTFPVFNPEIFDKFNETDKIIESRISTSSDETEPEPKPGPYCLWRGKSTGSSTLSSCRKSKLTGSLSFKLFKIRDLLTRSNSEGTSSFISATKSINRKAPAHSVESSCKTKASPLHELFYKEKRSKKEGDKRKSYLPYTKDLIGFFSAFGREISRRTNVQT